MFKFEKLDVWQEAVTFSDETYRCTGMFPEAERYGLVNQLRRSAVSIAALILLKDQDARLQQILLGLSRLLMDR